jgi:hypothetical protein
MDSTFHTGKPLRVLSWWCIHQNIPNKLMECFDGYTTKLRLCNRDVLEIDENHQPPYDFPST